MRAFAMLMGCALLLAGDCLALSQEEESPSLEMLEYLADWETSEGQWLDPMDVHDNQDHPDNTQADYRPDETDKP